MNTRRNFLKSIFAAVAPSPVVCRMAESFGVEQEAEPMVMGFDPACENAAYEVGFFIHQDCVADFPYREIEVDSPRFNFINGEFVRVEKHL